EVKGGFTVRPLIFSFIDCTLLDRSRLARHDTIHAFMEERYKGYVIRVTTEKDNSAFPWKPICRILDGATAKLVKEIDWADRLRHARSSGEGRIDTNEKMG